MFWLVYCPALSFQGATEADIFEGNSLSTPEIHAATGEGVGTEKRKRGGAAYILREALLIQCRATSGQDQSGIPSE